MGGGGSKPYPEPCSVSDIDNARKSMTRRFGVRGMLAPGESRIPPQALLAASGVLGLDFDGRMNCSARVDKEFLRLWGFDVDAPGLKRLVDGTAMRIGERESGGGTSVDCTQVREARGREIVSRIELRARRQRGQGVLELLWAFTPDPRGELCSRPCAQLAIRRPLLESRIDFESGVQLDEGIGDLRGSYQILCGPFGGTGLRYIRHVRTSESSGYFEASVDRRALVGRLGFLDHSVLDGVTRGERFPYNGARPSAMVQARMGETSIDVELRADAESLRLLVSQSDRGTVTSRLSLIFNRGPPAVRAESI